MFGDVQLTALRLAWRNRTNPAADRFGEDTDMWLGIDARRRQELGDESAIVHDVFVWEVLADLYGWQPRTRQITGETTRKYYGAQRFSVDEVGEAEYRSRSASVSRALSSLEARGYMERVRGAADLTEDGVDLCRRLFG